MNLLESPNSPLIRAELIKLFVRHMDKESIPALDRISQNPEEDQTIRELAEWSVEKLKGNNNETI
ncbi:hypothetical protein VDG1235_1503 [Verrucomicrobiia bacterium DG1235]|nr:hypothetical protein VDG1235_1503 [Verrucomicrobiae bacterium DG1235]